MRFVPILLVLIAGSHLAANEPQRAGADWWSLQPVKASGERTSAGIDQRIRERLTSAGLKPSPQADRLTLIRRVTFDVTGLPPTLAEIDAFIADKSDNAFAKVVERLLASSHYGERWARHWLDIVRYSESHGFEYDRLRDNAWPYRDYVIRSLNADKPYSQFVREQLAGDAYPEQGSDGIIATGMLVAGPYDQAGLGAASLTVRGKAREDELEDMVGTVSQTFLGLTLNCARCHDHKFDPLTARDYYRMKAFFDGVYPGERAANASEAKNTVADLEKQLAESRRRLDALETAARVTVLKDRPGIKGELPKSLPQPRSRWTFDKDGTDLTGGLHAELKQGARIERGRLLLEGQKAFAATIPFTQELTAKTLEAWVALPTLKQSGGGVLTVQTLNGGVFDSLVFAERKANHWIPGSDFFNRTRDVGGPEETAKPDELIHVALTYDHQGRVTMYRNGRIHGETYTLSGAKALATFAAKESQVLFGLRHTGAGNGFLQAEIEEARLYDTALNAEQIEASFRAGIDLVTREQLRAAMSEADRGIHAKSEEQIKRWESQLSQLRRSPLTYAAVVKPHPPSVLYKRGDFEKPGDAVNPASPVSIVGPPAVDENVESTNLDRRRALAEWVVHAKNPLTWRAIANRVWQHHFGDGLVRTPNDFGLNGERPTHPELLDELAASLIASGGSLKKLHRLILLSETYQQSSAFNEDAANKDADNRLLWRYAPRRLEAEAVRDAMLVASGKLNREAGGPSARPFKIETFNSAFYILFDEDKPEFNRRSVYRMNVTSARDPLLDVLDCPDPSVKTPRRNSTTTPLQALTMMNNPFTDRMSRSFVARVANEAGDDVARQIELAYRLAFGRPATRAERDRAAAVAMQSGLKAVCWALLNASEFAYLK